MIEEIIQAEIIDETDRYVDNMSKREVTREGGNSQHMLRDMKKQTTRAQKKMTDQVDVLPFYDALLHSRDTRGGMPLSPVLNCSLSPVARWSWQLWGT